MFPLSSVLLVVALGEMPEAGAVSPADVRAAVQRSVPYIQERGTWWIEEKNCVSCHRGNSMVWSLSEARRQQIEVSDQLGEWINWSTESSLAKNDKGTIVGLGNKEALAQMLVGLRSFGDKDGEIRKEFAALLLDGQQKDGSWKAGGQLPSQKRSKAETDAVSTMWITLALLDQTADEKTAATVERALKFIENSAPGESTEWYAVRLLLAIRQNNESVRQEMIEHLKSQQQPDGGWGWLIDDPSDALGTGLAMYALTKSDTNRGNATLVHAQKYLIETQREDGSWAVKGTKEKKKDSEQETATYWGTTWAALGLVTSLSNE
ncbi:MAG: terpene cyclase/mutase family protein [Planctomycetaceae bacterium]|nr:terpene cyclase/mutase family protein [Planctomycetaceae bacterium]